MVTKTSNQRLRELMERYGLTQADVATLTGMHPKSISNCLIAPEKDSVRNISENTLTVLEIKAPAYAAAKKLGKRKA